jgi:hypothetical protein
MRWFSDHFESFEGTQGKLRENLSGCRMENLGKLEPIREIVRRRYCFGDLPTASELSEDAATLPANFSRCR